jgi:glycosyltransferase involved in cell wall biosynthesis
MACGTPVIANRRGSMAEIIEHGVNGFLVDSHEEAVAAVAQAGELDRAAVRRSVQRRFHIDRMADEYIALYRSILDGKRTVSALPKSLAALTLVEPSAPRVA